jgi:hypothetical protein
MIFGGVFERRPRLLVGSVEHEMAWLAHFVERSDYSYTQRTPRAPWHAFAPGVLPSHFVTSNVFVSFMEDRPGVLARRELATAMITWGSDYPHTESTFPRSRDIVDRLLAGVDERERAAITFDTTARIYGFAAP